MKTPVNQSPNPQTKPAEQPLPHLQKVSDQQVPRQPLQPPHLHPLHNEPAKPAPMKMAPVIGAPLDDGVLMRREPLPTAAKVDELKHVEKNSPDRPKAEATLKTVEAAQPPTHAPGQRVRYAGQECEIVRDAMPGDTGYDAAKPGQVLIRDWNGAEKAVGRGEVQG